MNYLNLNKGSLHTSQISNLLLYPSLWLPVPGLSSQFRHYLQYSLLFNFTFQQLSVIPIISGYKNLKALGTLNCSVTYTNQLTFGQKDFQLVNTEFLQSCLWLLLLQKSNYILRESCWVSITTKREKIKQ